METAGISLRRLTIQQLEPDLNNVIVIALIIAKQRPRRFASAADALGGERGVWNFTLRDSPRDYVNATFWGAGDDVWKMAESFQVGDVVQIVRPKITIRAIDNYSEQFRPMVTSPYTLTLYDNQSRMVRSESNHELASLLKFPTKPLASFVSLVDIEARGKSEASKYANLLVAVRSVGIIRNVKTKSGIEQQVRDFIVLDRTSEGVKITVWDPDIIARQQALNISNNLWTNCSNFENLVKTYEAYYNIFTSELNALRVDYPSIYIHPVFGRGCFYACRSGFWKPRTTILFIADARVEYDQFHKCVLPRINSKTIITEDPIGTEAEQLRKYAETAPLLPFQIVEQLMTRFTSPEFIKNVMTTQQVRNKITNLLSTNLQRLDDRYFVTLMYGVVTQLDLDGLSRVTSTRCKRCKFLVRQNQLCENEECTMIRGIENVDLETTFDIRVNISDHSGCMNNCRLVGATAEKILGCTVQQFLTMTDDEKCELKWKYLLERCAIRLMVLCTKNRNPLISILSCSRAYPLEVAGRLPIG